MKDEYRTPPGFRFSSTDALILIIGTISAVGTSLISISLPFLIAFVVLHFFLFCNVFRINRRYELIWSILFLLNAAFLLSDSWKSILMVSLLQLPVTFLLIALELRKPTYHGVGWKIIRGLTEQ
ncbi:MAG: hypothetical protein SFY68_13925 [Candidatus Sumerlaeia bacterium]|nr:hypothetical protein [Candidatus Sumerlaeia bacterium]